MPLIKTFYRVGSGNSPYLTKIALTPKTPWGQLHLHIFHRGDIDHELHDHPWNFWTFPLVSYVEENWNLGAPGCRETRTVRRFRLHRRDAEYRHRVVGIAGEKRLAAAEFPDGRRIYTICWSGRNRREWGFWRRASVMGADGRIRSEHVFMPWREFHAWKVETEAARRRTAEQHNDRRKHGLSGS